MFATDFDAQNLPFIDEHIRSLPLEYVDAIMESLPREKFTMVKVAQVYDRKGEVAMDGLGNMRNKSYASEMDAYLIQFSAIVDAKPDDVTVKVLKAVESNLNRGALLDKHAALVKKQIELQEQRDSVENALNEVERMLSATD